MAQPSAALAEHPAAARRGFTCPEGRKPTGAAACRGAKAGAGAGAGAAAQGRGDGAILWASAWVGGNSRRPSAPTSSPSRDGWLSALAAAALLSAPVRVSCLGEALPAWHEWTERGPLRCQRGSSGPASGGLQAGRVGVLLEGVSFQAKSRPSGLATQPVGAVENAARLRHSQAAPAPKSASGV